MSAKAEGQHYCCFTSLVYRPRPGARQYVRCKIKTQKNDASVDAFIESVENEKKREDSKVILKLMKDITGDDPTMWGTSIIGFGSYRYQYADGRENAWFQTGFSPRKQNLTLYIMPGFERYDDLLSKLGKYKTGKSCLYVNKLEDVDLDVLKELVKESVEVMAASHTE